MQSTCMPNSSVCFSNLICLSTLITFHDRVLDVTAHGLTADGVTREHIYSCITCFMAWTLCDFGVTCS